MEKYFCNLLGKAAVIGGLFFSFFASAESLEVDQWRAGFRVDTVRSNPYGLVGNEYFSARGWGQWFSQYYPIEVTGVLPPLRPIRKILDDDFQNPLIKWLDRKSVV